MGYRAKLSTAARRLSEQAAAQSAQDRLVQDRVGNFTRDGEDLARAGRRVAPEQIAIGVLLVVSFVAPLWHFLG
jgi:hypothetical protein